jgi:alpha-mannosidase
MKEDEAFIFVSSSAAFYEWVERVDSQMFAEIKQRIKEGRREVVGGWWV